MKPLYLGIDPGASGGIVCLSSSRKVLSAAKMPDGDETLLKHLSRFGYDKHGNPLGDLPVKQCVLEQVGGYAGDGFQTGASMFNFGKGYGAIGMALVALNIPFIRKMSQVWQKGMSVVSRRKGEKREEFKRRLKAMAVEAFPEVTVTLWSADALLIADYCRKLFQET